jgi:hypothetical protein
MIQFYKNEQSTILSRFTSFGRELVWFYLCASLAMVVSATAHAQAIYGSVNGTIVDSSGAVIPNASITLTDAEKGTSQVVHSNESGNFLVEHLIPDTYSVRIQAQGFSTFEIKTLQVSADSTQKVDATLTLGTASQTVDVDTQAAQLKTDRADVSNTLNEQSLQDLPNITRNTTSFVLLAPGTTASTFSNSNSENPQASTPVAANGQSPFSAGFILDGADNKDSFLGVVVINPPLDSISELKFTTQNYDAEFGAAVAGIVVAQSKSGGNHFHGDAFEYRHSDAQQARDPFTEYPGVGASAGQPDVPHSLFNLFGGSVSGPIKKDKIFFFGDYQGIRQKTGAALIETVPTNLVHTSCASGNGCDLSEYLQGGQGQIYNPRTGDQTGGTGTGRTPFAGNLIPNPSLSPQGLKILSLLPLPTTGGIANNFVASGFGVYNTNQYDTRGDYQASEKLHIFGHYSYFGSVVSSPGSFGVLEGEGFGNRGFAGQSNGRNQSLSAGADYAVRPNLLADLRFAFLRYRIFQDKFNGSSDNFESNLGIPGLNSGGFGTGGVSAFFVTGLSNFGSGSTLNACNCPLNEQEQQFEVVNNWTKIIGNHSVKFGADLRYVMNLRIPSDQNRAGSFTFASTRTASGSSAVPGGLGLATLLIGDPTNFERFVSSSNNAAERQKRTFFYGEDSWRVTTKLTVNYGARWEIYFPETVNAKGNGGFLDLNTMNIRVAGYGGFGTNFNVKNTFSYIAPRLGLAYQATEKTVVRAGYGRTYDPGFFGDIFSAVVTQTLPVLANQNIFASDQYNYTGFTLAQGPAPYVFAPIPSNGLIPLPTDIGPATRPLQMKVPTVDAWNLTVQQQLAPTLSFQIGYVGNKGTHQIGDSTYGGYNANQATIEGFPNVPFCNRTPYFARFGDCQYIGYFGNAGTSHYNSLQTVLDKRFRKGLQFQASYVWSRAMANGDYGAYLLYNPRVSYGAFDYNRKHNFIAYSNYDLPFGHGRTFGNDVPGWVNGIIGGISVNGTLNWASGLPFTPSYNECGSDEDVGVCFPSKSGGGPNSAVGPLSNITHSRTFLPVVAPLTQNGQVAGPYQRPLVAQFGNLGFNSLFGPHFFNSDLAVIKSFNIHEGLTLQMEAQAQNVFNHVNLANPSTPCVDCTVASGAGQIFDILPGSNMRQLQFSGRFVF